ncbi:MAG: dTMP kinase [Saprospiraceae bacterium]
MQKKGKFIALEGIDGSGKSTQVSLLCHRLKAEGHQVYPTFEPTNGPIGSLIRQMFSRRIVGDDKTIAALFVADRLDHLQNPVNGLLKKLEEGYTVITDRYYFSSYAYHGAHMPLEWVIQSNALSAELLRPDLNIYIDISPEVGLQRVHANRADIEIYETQENIKKVHATYLKAFELLQNEERITKVDGNRPPAAIAEDIYAIAHALMVEV